MYSVALSVAACLRAETDVHVAWIVQSSGLPALDPTEAVAFTPGGGRMGGLAGGVLDTHLTDIAVPGAGRILTVEMSDTDALIAGLPAGGRAALAVVSAAALPHHVWGVLLERRPVALVAELDDGRITDIAVVTADDATGDARIRDLLAAGTSTHELTDERLVTVLAPVPRLAVSGGGPIAEAIEAAGRLVGWQVVRAEDPDTAIGLMVGLSTIDAAVVIGHDVEASSRVLGAALEGGAGYIGSLGSAKMQRNRADWLAYRGVTDLARVHGPAGLDISARSAGEIAVSVVAEAIAVLNGAHPADT